jgi:NAD(P)-dependent dehydrogenase (short-subunit alcohol dehydrogenase family)
VLKRIIATHEAKQGREAGPSHSVEVVALDLGRIASARAVADDINARVADGRLPPVRALVQNAGYQDHTEQNFSVDGFDMSFHANYLNHWLLTVKLLQSFDKESGRVVVVGSYTHE